MKKTGWTSLAAAGFIVLTMLGFWGTKFLLHKSTHHNLNHLALKNPKTATDIVENSHPYGRPFNGVLSWENSRGFHEFCAKNKVSMRMSAFQTTLPDPLPGEEYNVALAADLLAGTVVKPGKVFSIECHPRTL